jgi:hypothetical protein
VLEYNIICVNAFAPTPDSGVGDDDMGDRVSIDDEPAAGGAIQNIPAPPPSPPPGAGAVVVNDDDDDDDPDDGGYCCCPFNRQDKDIDAILLILNHIVILLLEKIGCTVKKAQLFGKEAKFLSSQFAHSESIFHPAVIQHSLNGEITPGNEFQKHAINSYVAELIRTHPLNDFVRDDKKVFNAFKKKLTEDQPSHAYLCFESYDAMKEYSMDIKQALSRFRNQNWSSNMKKTNFSLDQAQFYTSSDVYQKDKKFIYPSPKLVFKLKVYQSYIKFI